MTEDKFNLSRRKALAALGTIGVASAGAGLGTSAYFSDQETFENNQLTAGTLDMKVAATEYYSDWSPDEAEYAGMASGAESTDIRLPAGDEQTDAQDIALDLDDDYDGDASDVYAAFFEAISTDENGDPYNRVNGGVSAAADGLCGTGSDADGPVIIDVGDVKPGDFGGAQFAFELCDNPGYVWLNGGLRDASENGTTEPEADDPDEEDGVVELLDEIQVAYGVGPINGGTSAFENTDSGFQPVEQYSLREFLNSVNSGNGLELDGNLPAEQGGGTGRDCFAGATAEDSLHQVSVVWWLPINHGNQVQSDSVTFDLGFYTEQCRHNDGSGIPQTIQGSVGSGDFSQISYEKALGMQMLSRAGSGRGEIQIHSDSGGVENTTLWGSSPGDTFPADTDIPFTVEINPDAATASLTVNDTTVTDNDLTDGTANGSSTGDSEFPSGVPSELDIAVTAGSGTADVTTVVKDLSVDGKTVQPASVSAQDSLTYVDLTGLGADSTLTLNGTLRFEGPSSAFSGQEFVGVDVR